MNSVPDVSSYPLAHTIPVMETLSMNDVQSLVLSQLALATFLNMTVTDPVEPPWHHALLVIVAHPVLLGA